jgi:hypothetical protein
MRRAGSRDAPAGQGTRDRLPPTGTGVAHAFVADSGEAMELLFLGERKGNDVILSTPTRAKFRELRT